MLLYFAKCRSAECCDTLKSFKTFYPSSEMLNSDKFRHNCERGGLSVQRSFYHKKREQTYVYPYTKRGKLGKNVFKRTHKSENVFGCCNIFFV